MKTRRVAVFFDWQNAYRAARRAFGWEGWPSEVGNFSPYDLARLLATRNERGSSGELCRVEVHRGLPDSTRDPVGHGACRRQSSAWMAENPQLVIPRLRALRYPPDWPKQPEREKGVDVQLALGLLECVISGACDVAVLVSNDTDLMPAIETVVRLRGSDAIETAAWWGDKTSPRLRPKSV